MIVITDLETLQADTAESARDHPEDRRGIPPGELVWGGPISAAAVRRIACDAGVTRVITDPAGVPLDVGREHRSVTPGQFAGLVARDGGCAFPGCTRPAAWTHAHHIVHWADGGPTDLDNLVLTCGHHHRAVHHSGWQVRLGAHRLPEFVPPAWIDPDRTPQRNTRPRHHRKRKPRWPAARRPEVLTAFRSARESGHDQRRLGDH